MAGPQRGTSARGKRQGVLERAKKYYGETGMYDPSKINQFASRGIVDKYVELPSDKRRVLNTDRRTMSEEDSSLADKAELAGKALYLSKLLKEDPGMYRRIVQGDMDEAMREGAKRFERSSESDSPGYKKGGGVKKFGPRYGFKRFAQGGSASKRADGCAVKGKTRGKFV